MKNSFFTGYAQNLEVTGLYDTPSFVCLFVFSLEWFSILLRSKCQGRQRALEMEPRGSAGHDRSLLN